MDAYAKLYADSRLWLASGWLDYFAPQLYWPVDSPQQSFPVLLNWWAEQNVKGRHLWPGLNAANVGEKWGPDEIARQMQIMRRQSGAGGEIFYHLRNLTGQSRAGRRRPRRIPATRARAGVAVAGFRAAGQAETRPSAKTAVPACACEWETAGGEPAWLWVLQFRTNEVWTTEILPAEPDDWTFANSSAGCDFRQRGGPGWKLSAPAALRKRRAGAPGKTGEWNRIRLPIHEFEMRLRLRSAARNSNHRNQKWFWKGCKPNSVCPLRAERIICLSSRYPEPVPLSRNLERAAPGSLFGLAPDGVFRAASLALRAVRSYPTFSPLPPTLANRRRFNFLWHCPSESLSTFRPRVSQSTSGPEVTRHRALWCSDFPPPARAGSDSPPFQNQLQ